MLMHIKRENSWVANANGHVLAPHFFREFRRKGAQGATMSEVQWTGFFGKPYKPNGENPHQLIDTIPVVMDTKLPDDEIDFFIGSDLLGKITNLYVPPKPKDESKSPK